MPVLFTFWLALLPFFKFAAPDAPRTAGTDHCRIYGSIYLERDPRYKNDARYTVFLNEDEAFADLVVYRESNKLFADATAVWYLTPNKAFADHILYVTDNRNLADITVHFTTVRSFAACRE